MSSEPNHPIEPQLRAYAAQRRKAAGDGLAMHPATRRLLQGEVARVHRRRPTASRFGFLRHPLFWPRVSLAGSAFVLAGVLAWIWFESLSPQPSTDLLALAKNKLDQNRKPLAQETRLAPEAPAPALPKQPRELVATGGPKAATPPPPATPPAVPRAGAEQRTRTRMDQALEAAPAAAGRTPVRRRLARAEERAATPPAAEAPPLETPTKSKTLSKNAPAREAIKSLVVASKPASADALKDQPMAFGNRVLAESNALLALAAATNGAEAWSYSLASDAAYAPDKMQQFSLAKQATAPKVVAPKSQVPFLVSPIKLSAPSPDSPRTALRNVPRVETSTVAAGPLATSKQTAPAGVVSTRNNLPRMSPLGRFKRLSSPAPNGGSQTAAAGANFLAAFELEQQDNRLRIIDADGSVYEGSLLAGAAQLPPSAGADQQPPTLEARRNQPAPLAPGTQTKSTATKVKTTLTEAMAFRLAGTNRTLNQFVLIQGTLSARPPDAFRSFGTAPPGPAATPAAAPSASAPNPIIKAAPILVKRAARRATSNATLDVTASNLPSRPAAPFTAGTKPLHFRGTAVIDRSNTVQIEAIRIAP